METLDVVRKPNYTNSRRSYSLFLNGSKVGSIKNGQRISVPIEPGQHIFVAKIDWIRSEPLEILVVPGSKIVIEIGLKDIRFSDILASMVAGGICGGVGFAIAGILGAGLGAMTTGLVYAQAVCRPYSRLIPGSCSDLMPLT